MMLVTFFFVKMEIMTEEGYSRHTHTQQKKLPEETYSTQAHTQSTNKMCRRRRAAHRHTHEVATDLEGQGSLNCST
jgi:hypothetical protein